MAKKEPTNGAKKHRNGSKPQVTEPEARAAYLVMDGRRSAERLRDNFIAAGRKTPSERNFKTWRAAHAWPRLAKEHDEKVAQRASARITTNAVARVVSRAAQFDTLATDSLVKAIEGLANLDVSALKAGDIRALTEISERAAKMHELLEGRATDRTDDLTRSKMDELLGDMQTELEERLASVTTVH